MTALQQSTQFARALTMVGADVASTEPVILQRRIGAFGHLAFASRAHAADVAQTPVRVLNGEGACPRPYRAAGLRQTITPAHIAEWDLTQRDLRQHLHGKWRNRLKKAEAAGLRIKESAWDGSTHVMFAQTDALARKRRFKTYPVAVLSAFAQCNPNHAVLFEAFDRGTLIAACLILRHGKTATYQTAWTSDTGRALQAPALSCGLPPTRWLP